MSAGLVEKVKPRVKQRACSSCGGDRRAMPRLVCQDVGEHKKLRVTDLPPWPCCGGQGDHLVRCSHHPRYKPDADELVEPEFCRAQHPIHPAACIRGAGHPGSHQLATGARWATK